MTKTEKAAPLDNDAHYHPAIQLFAITPSKTNPRKHFEPKDLEDLAASIAQKGIIEPIIVRQWTGTKGATGVLWEIVAGERRWRASKLAGMTTIPAIARELTDTQALEIQVIENQQREDVHELEEAHGYKSLMDSAGYDVKTIAEKVGTSEEYVYARLKLLNLIPELQKMFVEGGILGGHAILIARLPADSQRDCKKVLIIEDYNHMIGQRTKNLITVRDLGLYIQRHLNMDLSKAPFPIELADLVKKAGACPACPKRSSAEPSLWPELKKGDHCTDRGCFDSKVAAFVKQEIEDGHAVITSDWQLSQKAKYKFISDVTAVKANSCDFTTFAVVIDGAWIGEKINICESAGCKVHHRKHDSGPGNANRSESTPAEAFETSKRNIDQGAAKLLGDEVYKAMVNKLQLLGADLPKIAQKSALLVILRMVHSRMDSSARNVMDNELGMPPRDYSGTHIAKLGAKLNSPQLLALIVRMALRDISMGFNAFSGDRNQIKNKELLTVADSYGLKTATIEAGIAEFKKSKLEKAKTRLENATAAAAPAKSKKLHTSAKKKGK